MRRKKYTTVVLPSHTVGDLPPCDYVVLELTPRMVLSIRDAVKRWEIISTAFGKNSPAKSSAFPCPPVYWVSCEEPLSRKDNLRALIDKRRLKAAGKVVYPPRGVPSYWEEETAFSLLYVGEGKVWFEGVPLVPGDDRYWSGEISAAALESIMALVEEAD
jgi:hypothetical protein